MKRLVSLLAAVAVVAAVAFFLAPTQPALSASFPLLEFNSMHGVPLAYTGATNPVRGLNGGGLPWVLTSAHGVLNANGHLEIGVNGLVLDPTDPTVISRGLAGDNPIPNFKAVVSCLSVDGSGAAVTVNVSSPVFPATTGLATDGGGDAQFVGFLSLPSPCLAPIVFITSPTGAWFAVTGN
jgi:hypothetical protein